MRGEVPDLVYVLLIEDDPADALMIREALGDSRLPVRLARARSGPRAMRFLRHRETRLPDVILLDLGLPGRHGLQVLADLKADPRLRTIPVVVVTASRRPGDQQRSQDLGASGYIVKPTDFDGLIAMVRQVEDILGLTCSPA
jgi:CheY-like chemotaxis protein